MEAPFLLLSFFLAPFVSPQLRWILLLTIFSSGGLGGRGGTSALIGPIHKKLKLQSL